MDRFSVYSAGFSASHQQGSSHVIDRDYVRLHGHDWRVTLTAKGDEDRDLENRLIALGQELSRDTLENMLPGASTTASGIAAWLMERLGMQFPEIVRIEVECAGHAGYVEREARRSL